MLLIIIAFLFMYLAIELQNNTFWCSTIILADTFIWFLLAASVLEIEIPYEMYNATSGQIETGTHIWSSKIAPALVYFFMMFAVIMMIYGVGYVIGPVVYNALFKKRYDYRGRR